MFSTCNTDTDCISIGNLCPLGCEISINQSYKEKALWWGKFWETSLPRKAHYCEPCPKAETYHQCVQGFCQSSFSKITSSEKNKLNFGIINSSRGLCFPNSAKHCNNINSWKVAIRENLINQIAYSLK